MMNLSLLRLLRIDFFFPLPSTGVSKSWPGHYIWSVASLHVAPSNPLPQSGLSVKLPSLLEEVLRARLTTHTSSLCVYKELGTDWKSPPFGAAKLIPRPAEAPAQETLLLHSGWRDKPVYKHALASLQPHRNVNPCVRKCL